MNKKSIERYLKKPVKDDLKSKMVFVGGPRQVGKTTFALSFLKDSLETNPAYLNWDNINRRPSLMNGEIPSDQRLLILDEIHKYKKWRDLLKGFYDTYRSRTSFLVTGSARLDYYRKGGDSLQGRYHYYRLHPFSPLELNTDPTKSDINDFLKYGGFPEPLLKGDERFHRRWQKERLSRVVSEDLRDLENVKEISLLELMLEDLPHRIGSPLSVKNLRETLNIAHDTVERWLTILERLYVIFRISPFGAPKIRAVKKEQKVYFWDWSQCIGGGNVFENFVACQLLRFCHFIEDTEGYKTELRFIRDIDKREVDFVVIKNGVPLFAIECKTGEKRINPHVFYFKERTKIETFYQVHLGTKDYGDAKNSVRVIPIEKFLKILDEQ